MKTRLLILLLVSLVGVAGCDNPQVAKSGVSKKEVAFQAPLSVERWYNQAQTQRGDALFQANCASCHMPVVISN